MSTTGTFLELVAGSYDEIKVNFKIGLNKIKYSFDEDLFSDAILKCNSTLGDKIITKEEALKYFWVAYINGYKNQKKSNWVKKSVPITDDFNIIDSRPECDYEIDNIYREIINILKDKFGEKNTEAWVKHILFKKPYNKMLEDGEIPQNFHYIVKKIKKFLYSNVKKNKNILNMINNIRTT